MKIRFAAVLDVIYVARLHPKTSVVGEIGNVRGKADKASLVKANQEIARRIRLRNLAELMYECNDAALPS